MTKYHNTKVTLGGITFDSKLEADRWAELTMLERLGVIQNLERQKEYVLIPTQKLPTPISQPSKGGGYMKSVEKAVKYVADFVYQKDGQTVVEDTKGFKTEGYIIKRKLMLYVHGIQVMEI